MPARGKDSCRLREVREKEEVGYDVTPSFSRTRYILLFMGSETYDI